ncbi:MAG: hypothetical protein ACXWLH_02595 [Candidatus Saccharimonadales bacterium]
MTETNTSTVLEDIKRAGDITYDQLTNSGLPASEVHRMQICYEASDLLMSHLVEMGHQVRREIHTPENRMGDQNYVVIENPDGSEIIADPTWQLYVKPEAVRPDTPRVLAGSRDEAIAIARDHGVTPDKLKLWEKSSVKMDVQDQKQADRTAEDASAKAEKHGGWDRFVLSSTDLKKGHRRVRRSRNRVKTSH